jgi:hypothetical protein
LIHLLRGFPLENQYELLYEAVIFGSRTPVSTGRPDIASRLNRCEEPRGSANRNPLLERVSRSSWSVLRTPSERFAGWPGDKKRHEICRFHAVLGGRKPSPVRCAHRAPVGRCGDSESPHRRGHAGSKRPTAPTSMQPVRHSVAPRRPGLGLEPPELRVSRTCPSDLLVVSWSLVRFRPVELRPSQTCGSGSDGGGPSASCANSGSTSSSLATRSTFPSKFIWPPWGSIARRAPLAHLMRPLLDARSRSNRQSTRRLATKTQPDHLGQLGGPSTRDQRNICVVCSQQRVWRLALSGRLSAPSSTPSPSRLFAAGGNVVRVRWLGHRSANRAFEA